MNTSKEKKSVVHALMMLIILCYPVLLLTIKGGMNGAFFLMLMAALWCMYSPYKVSGVKYWDDLSVKFAVAMTLPAVAVLLSQAAHGELIVSHYDGPSRFFLAIPIFMALRNTNMRVLAILQYGFPLGAISAAFIVLFGTGYQRSYDYYSGTHRVASYFLDLIHFGDFALLLGLLSFISINWRRHDPPYVLLLKMIGLIAGLYVSFQSGSRGAWIAIPLVWFAWYFFAKRKKISLASLAMSLISVAALMIAVYFWNHIFRLRIDELSDHLVMAAHGELDSTIGIRLQHWKAAIYMFIENPFFGVGSDGFPQAIVDLQHRGLVTEKAAFEGTEEVHSDIFASIARLGLFGLLSSLSLYLVPLAMFIKLAKSSSVAKNVSALMGVCFVLCFFTFGLTVEIFSLKMASAFYGFTLAVLLAGATLENSKANEWDPKITNDIEVLRC